MMSLIQPLISIGIISLIWIWIIRQIFTKSSKQQIITTSLRSVISVISISIIHYLSSQYNIREQYHTLFYIIIISISILLFAQKKRTVAWFIQAIGRIALLLTGGNAGGYSISALGEESFKRIYIKKFVLGLIGEIILLGIISGIVFGRTENIIYVIQSLSHMTLIQEVTLLQQRSFIPILLHSGSISIAILIGYMLQEKIGGIWSWVIGISSGIALHYLFNIFQIYNLILGVIIIIIGCIGLLHYSLFRSDSIYISRTQ